ncbi:A1 protein [Vibrio phage vB_VorS-PVo5]|nr:A1 protein [Vibrio phage vB_VorS-PVo5]
MQKVIETNRETILAAAKDNNFWGKRLRERKLGLCDAIVKSCGLTQSQLESGILCDWLEANKPQPKAKPKVTAANKPDANTMTGESKQKLALMPTVEGQKFIVTTAQNNTNVSPVFEQLKTLANEIDATLVVLPVFYNKNAFSSAVESEDEFFAQEVRPYLIENDSWLGEEMAVRVMPSAAVNPTAKYPINKGRDLMAGELVNIIPATKQQMLTKPRMPSQPISEAWATGCCTVYNYTRSGAGSEAEKNHVFGGLFVEVFDGQVNVTNLRQADDGSLMLLDSHEFGFDVYSYGTDKAYRPAVVLGDLHCEMQDKEAYAKTLNWLHTLKPSLVAVHDILHFETRSHHNRKSGKHLYKMQVLGQTVHNDLIKVIEQLNQIAETTDTVYIVESNHNSALDNWLDDSAYSPKNDPINAKLYYLLNYAMCEALEQGHDKTALELAFTEVLERANLPQLADNIEFGSMGVSKVVNGYDLSQHGHKGQNGSNGNTTLFSKWNVKMVSGHTHSPMIVGDVYTVGVMAKLNQGYNVGGASSWNHANVVIHPNNTCQLVRVFNLTK